jgi:hypothetical protein
MSKSNNFNVIENEVKNEQRPSWNGMIRDFLLENDLTFQKLDILRNKVSYPSMMTGKMETNCSRAGKTGMEMIISSNNVKEQTMLAAKMPKSSTS